MTMLKRVAEILEPGIFDEPGCKCVNCQQSVAAGRKYALDKAREVVTAMREPTDEMCHQAMLTIQRENQGLEYSPKVGWKAMIDAVLKELKNDDA